MVVRMIKSFLIGFNLHKCAKLSLFDILTDLFITVHRSHQYYGEYVSYYGFFKRAIDPSCICSHGYVQNCRDAVMTIGKVMIR